MNKHVDDETIIKTIGWSEEIERRKEVLSKTRKRKDIRWRNYQKTWRGNLQEGWGIPKY